MNIIVAVYSAILFFILTPNIVVRFPSNGSKMTVAMVHATVFGIILYFTQKIIHNLFKGVVEGVVSAKSLSPEAAKSMMAKAASSQKGAAALAAEKSLNQVNQAKLHPIGIFH